MSRKNSVHQKKVRRLRRALQVSPPAYINLLEYMVDHGYAPTKKEATEIILAKRVRADSHPLGVARAYDPVLDREVEYVSPFVPAELRGRIVVSSN